MNKHIHISDVAMQRVLVNGRIHIPDAREREWASIVPLYVTSGIIPSHMIYLSLMSIVRLSEVPSLPRSLPAA